MLISNLPVPVIFEVSTLTQDYYSGQSGLAVGQKLDDLVTRHIGHEIIVSMYGIDSIGPSFVNGAFLYVFDLYGEDYFRRYIKIKQASPQVATELGEAIKNHIAERKSFFETLNTTNLYIAVDNSDEAMAYRYRIWESKHNVHNQQVYFNPDDKEFSNQSKRLIAQSDAVIAIGQQKDKLGFLLSQIDYALTLSKPVLLILHADLYVKIPRELKLKVQTLKFKSESKDQMMRNLNEIIINNRINNPEINPLKKTVNSDDSALWAAIGLLGLFVVGAILFDEK